MLKTTSINPKIGRYFWNPLSKLIQRNFTHCRSDCPKTPKDICAERFEANLRPIKPHLELQKEGECHYPRPCVHFQSHRSCIPRKPPCPKWEYECNCAEKEGQKHMTCVEMVTTKMDPNECCQIDSFANTPCATSRNKGELKRENEPFKSMWNFQRDCCNNNPCPHLLPRFDELYWCPSDKYSREYQQTWVECPRLKITPRRTCCYEDLGLPPVCRRVKQDKVPTACAFNPKKLIALRKLCPHDPKCPRICMPCCMRGRVPPRCTRSHPKANCKKYCCPYPSLAECCRQCPKPLKPTECTCRPAWTPACDIYTFLRRKQIYDIPPPLPAWPPKTGK